MTVSIAQGDLLKQNDVDAIVNTVNCVGVMGKGIALQFKNKWPNNYKLYRAACGAGEVKIGKMLVFDCGRLVKPHYIINFPTKDHWRGKSKIESIEKGLVDLVRQIQRLDIRSVAVPPLGCGNGGLSWLDVRPLIEQAFAAVPDVDVRLFEPAETPPAREMEINTERPRMTPGRAAILTLLSMYRALNYTLSQIEVQKLAYFLQATGEDLRLTFEPHNYGPYSTQIRHVLNRMEGHFIRGVGDGVVGPEIELLESALEEATRYIQSVGNRDLTERVRRVAELIEGFQTPYGMELLSTVHWVATHDPKARSASDALEAIREWNTRKRDLMNAHHVRVAWDRLREGNWLGEAVSTDAEACPS